jgi:uncharacterized protein
MQNKLLAIVIGITLATGPTRAATETSLPADVGLGRVAWFDIATPDLAKSKDFYGKLFDWQFTPIPGTDLAFQIVSRGTTIGSLRMAEGKIAPFNGVVYIQVADILASSKRVKELGGTVIPGFPFNLSDRTGAISLAVDPAGHPIGMYSRTPMVKVPPPAK